MIYIFLAVIFLSSCSTVPHGGVTSAVDIMEAQTVITGTATELSASIEAVKTITDETKRSGEIPKEKTREVIKYIDLSSSLVASLKEELSGQTARVAEFERRRIEDNAKYESSIDDLTSKNASLKEKLSARLVVILILSFVIIGYSVIKLVIK
jgi:malonyl CoA-acyl carrier protein transacylase